MKFSFCFIILILICSISAQVENENTYLNSIEILNGNNTQNFVELRIIIADNEIGNFMIFNIKGQKIMSKQYFTGEHGLSLFKLKYGSGLFFYKLRTNSYFKSGKIIMLK